MRAFDLLEPASIEDAVALLSGRENAMPLGGGAVLTFLLREGLAAADCLVSVAGIEGLAGIAEQNGRLTIGAATTMRELERSLLVQQRLPVLAEAARLVGNVRVRSVATIGGHLAQADIHLDLPPVLVALDAEVRLHGPAGARVLPLSDFLLGYYETALQPGELVTELRIPLPHAGRHGAYFKYCTGSLHDWPTLGVAAFLSTEDGRVHDARLAAGGVADRPLRVPDAEALLQGEPLSAAGIAEVARRYAAAADPIGDSHGSAGYKREMTGVFVRRALRAAAARAGLEVRDG